MKTLALVLLGCFLGGLLTVPLAQSQDLPMMPVIMVHGLYGNKYNFSTIRARLIKAGYPSDWLVAFDLVPNDTMCDPGHVDQIDAMVRKVLADTGAPQVDLIGHSSGGLDNLNYVRYAAGSQLVRNWIALGSPLALSCRTGFHTTPPDDMTPGDTTLYTSIYSVDDGVVPWQLSILDGAHNVSIAGVSHGELLVSREVFDHILDALHGSGLNVHVPESPHMGHKLAPSAARNLPIRWAEIKAAD